MAIKIVLISVIVWYFFPSFGKLAVETGINTMIKTSRPRCIDRMKIRFLSLAAKLGSRISKLLHRSMIGTLKLFLIENCKIVFILL